MYLNQQNFKDFEGYINISFVSFNIIGTMVSKEMYSRNLSRRVQFALQLAILLIGILALVTIYISRLTPDQKWTLLALIGVVGFCVGGLHHLFANHEIILLTERNSEDILVNLNIIHGLAFLLTGITQVITGAFSSLNANSIFLVFLCECVISLASVGWRIFLEHRRNQEQAELAFDEDSD